LQKSVERLTSGTDAIRVYRLGEDEFVLLLENCGDPLVATEVVEAGLKRLTAQFDLDGHQLSSRQRGLAMRRPMVRTSMICSPMPTGAL